MLNVNIRSELSLHNILITKLASHVNRLPADGAIGLYIDPCICTFRKCSVKKWFTHIFFEVLQLKLVTHPHVTQNMYYCFSGTQKKI